MNCGSSKEILIFFHLKNNDIAQNCVWRNVTEKIFKTDIITDMRKVEGTKKNINYNIWEQEEVIFGMRLMYQNCMYYVASKCFLVKAVIKLAPIHANL